MFENRNRNNLSALKLKARESREENYKRKSSIQRSIYETFNGRKHRRHHTLQMSHQEFMERLNANRAKEAEKHFEVANRQKKQERVKALAKHMLTVLGNKI